MTKLVLKESMAVAEDPRKEAFLLNLLVRRWGGPSAEAESMAAAVVLVSVAEATRTILTYTESKPSARFLIRRILTTMESPTETIVPSSGCATLTRTPLGSAVCCAAASDGIRPSESRMLSRRFWNLRLLLITVSVRMVNCLLTVSVRLVNCLLDGLVETWG